MIQESFFRHAKVKLNYIEGPKNGPSFLLLPAYDNRWQSYSSIIQQLATNTHLFALDTRGRGRSDHTPGEYNLRYSLQDTINFIEEVIQEPCHIFGHSRTKIPFPIPSDVGHSAEMILIISFHTALTQDHQDLAVLVHFTYTVGAVIDPPDIILFIKFHIMGTDGFGSRENPVEAAVRIPYGQPRKFVPPV